MCSARTSVLVVTGPGERPEGCHDATQRHADLLGLHLVWQDLAAEDELVGAIQSFEAEHDVLVLASGDLADSRPVAEAVGTARRPVVHVDVEVVDHLDIVHRACDHMIHGRHRRSFHGALDWFSSRHGHAPETIPYGSGPDQVGDLRLPSSTGAAPIVVLLHGGFWLDPYERDLMGPLAVSLTRDGWATWNVEYRRTGPSGGGWPATVEDACAAVDAVARLADRFPIDRDRMVLLGHSAGAQLAVYATARATATGAAPSTPPRPRPAGLISLAGVLDLQGAAAAGLGGGAVTTLFGSAEEHPERYHLASPIERLPLGIPQLAVHGSDDHLVPVDQTHRYVEVARAAGDAVATAYPTVHHLDIVAPTGESREVVSAWLDRFAAPQPSTYRENRGDRA